LDAPIGASIYTEGPGEVSAWGSGRADDLRNRTRPPSSPAPSGQRREQLNHLTRQWTFRGSPQNADPDGSIGALSARIACTAEGAQGRSPGDEASDFQ
jgi:hypothetical protein